MTASTFTPRTSPRAVLSEVAAALADEVRVYGASVDEGALASCRDLAACVVPLLDPDDYALITVAHLAARLEPAAPWARYADERESWYAARDDLAWGLSTLAETLGEPS